MGMHFVSLIKMEQSSPGIIISFPNNISIKTMKIYDDGPKKRFLSQTLKI